MADDKNKDEAPPVLVDGRFGAQESDDNSIDVSNPAYVGVDAEYRNHAAYGDEDPLAPALSEDKEQAKVEKEASEREREALANAVGVGFRGYTPDTPHPSEAVKPQDRYIEGNRAFAEKLAEEAGVERKEQGEPTTAAGSAAASPQPAPADEEQPKAKAPAKG